MKEHSMPEMKEGGVNVTPLIDIVMCLIIFYMLVAKIGVTSGADAKIQIPDSVLGLDIKDMGNTLTLNVSAPPDGASREPIVSALIPDPLTKTPVMQTLRVLPREGETKKELVEVLKHIRNTNFKPENVENFKVIIHAQKDMKYGYLEPVLISCAEANVPNVNFATNKVEKRTPATPE